MNMEIISYKYEWVRHLPKFIRKFFIIDQKLLCNVKLENMSIFGCKIEHGEEVMKQEITISFKDCLSNNVYEQLKEWQKTVEAEENRKEKIK